MKRSDIKGFTLNVFGYFVEFVFVNCFLKVVEVSKPLNSVIRRFEVK